MSTIALGDERASMGKTFDFRSATDFRLESDFVSELCRALPQWIDCPSCNCRLAREVSVGGTKADVAIFQGLTANNVLPRSLSARESAILASLRVLGDTRVDVLERRCGFAQGALRDGKLNRLVRSGLVVRGPGGRISRVAAALTKCLIAIEAKLLKWRNAIRQALDYRSYADQAYVALPAAQARVALENREEFSRNGVGLLLLQGGRIRIAIQAPYSESHDWRREFILSRIVHRPPYDPTVTG